MSADKAVRDYAKADAQIIAEAAVACADKAIYWKERALAAEEALSKFAGEIYARDRDGTRSAGTA
jgi:hypothetical protein